MSKRNRIYLLQLVLFITTIFTVTLAGEFWIRGKMWLATEFDWADFREGMTFTIPFLLFLTVHEFGHYFTARKHRVSTTLPWFIPLPPFIFVGTMGAVIRITGRIRSKLQYFDIGVAGPLAGFVIAIATLGYGFTHLPDQEYIYDIHPEYRGHGINYGETLPPNDSTMNLAVGKNLLFIAMENTLVDDPSLLPGEYEIMHYPYLFAGFLALFFTALNLLPIGQLDGGHVLYGLFGYRIHFLISKVVFTAFLFYAGYGLFSPADSSSDLLWAVVYIYFLYIVFRSFKKSQLTTLMYALIMFTAQFLIPLIYPGIEGYGAWLFFAFVISRFLGIEHPRASEEKPLSWQRKLIGWIALLIFILSFSPQPFVVM